MNFIKRITATLSASLDSVVGQIENHDAIVETALKQTRQAAAKTKARLHRLQQQQETFKRKYEQLSEQYNEWSERAKKLASTDKDTALQCLARRKQCEISMQNTELAILQQRDLIDQVSNSLQSLEQKMTDMSQQHNLLRSRQSVAETNRVLSQLGHNHDVDLQDTFERWESAIIEHEVLSEQGNLTISDVDPLEQSFKNEEARQSLLMELQALTQSQSDEQTDIKEV